MFIASAANISGAVRTSGQSSCDIPVNFRVRSSEPRSLWGSLDYKHATPIGVNNSLQVPSTTLVP